MSSNDHGREFDTALAEAFRRAGYDMPGARVLSDDLKTGLHPLQVRIAASGPRQTPAIPFEPADLPELDLHGCNQDQAYERLEAFIRVRHSEGHRKVLVITGKGSGTLKRRVPYWLVGGLRKFVADVRPANPWHGGDGALYVYLREG